MTRKPSIFALLVSVGIVAVYSRGEERQAAVSSAASDEAEAISPAVSTDTGLLLEPPLELAWFTRERFVREMQTVGADKIGKPWKSPVVKLPPHGRADANGLKEDEIKAYMRHSKELFDRGEAIPVSDVGLISTQEDVIRQPMLNHIAAFENATVRVYLLVQRTLSDKGWSYFSIVQDMTVDPPLDYFAQIHPTHVQFEGTSCYKCHSSGPLAIHPTREDLVLDAKLAAALSQHIAEQPRSKFYFPEDSPKPASGKPLTLDFCTACHDEYGDRATLYQVHFHPIRVMVDFGYMPPGQRLTPEEIAQLKAWLDDRP